MRLRDVVVQRPGQTVRRPPRKNERHPGRIAGRQLVLGCEGEQHAAPVGPPIVAKKREIAPAAMIGAADRGAGLVDRTAAGRAQVLAANTGRLLEFRRIDLGNDAADRTVAARPPVHQLHELYSVLCVSAPYCPGRWQATRAARKAVRAVPLVLRNCYGCSQAGWRSAEPKRRSRRLRINDRRWRDK